MRLQSSATMKYWYSSACRVPLILLRDFRGRSGHYAMHCHRTYRHNQIVISHTPIGIVVSS